MRFILIWLTQINLASERAICACARKAQRRTCSESVCVAAIFSSAATRTATAYSLLVSIILFEYL